MRPPRRIVITGLGPISPNGLGVDAFWSSVRAGDTSAAGVVTRFDSSEMPSRLACEIRGFEPALYLRDAKKAGRMDRSVQYAVAAGRLALADAGLRPEDLDPDRVGVVEGTSVSGLDNTLREHRGFVSRGYSSIRPTQLVGAFAGGGSSEIALDMQFFGQATTITTACSAGNDALGYAARAIRDDVADVMLAGATEAPIIDGYYSIFASLGVMSRRNDAPGRAMRPFDRDRDGFVIGEGATFLVLEELSHALARGARIYAEWGGHGQATEAHHPVALHPEGRGTLRAVERALFNAAMAPDQIDYLNAHGSATGTNDSVETAVFKKVFGRHARRLAVNSTKPVTGHQMGATAAVEVAICALTLFHQVIPPTANLENPAEGCDLDYVVGSARPFPVRAAMNVNAGFGGKNSALILTHYRGTDP